MLRTRLFGPAVLALVLNGCSGGGSDFAERFVTACSSTASMPEGVCDCLAERAEEEISDDARALLLAMLEQDEDAAEELRNTMPVTDAMQAGLFMTEAGQCQPPGEGS